MILCIVGLMLLVCSVAASVMFGATFLVVCGDLCVCILIIMGIVRVAKALFGKKD